MRRRSEGEAKNKPPGTAQVAERGKGREINQTCPSKLQPNGRVGIDVDSLDLQSKPSWIGASLEMTDQIRLANHLVRLT